MGTYHSKNVCPAGTQQILQRHLQPALRFSLFKRQSEPLSFSNNHPFSLFSFKAVVLKALTPTSPHQHHLGACYANSPATPGPVNQNLGVGLSKLSLTSPLGN